MRPQSSSHTPDSDVVEHVVIPPPAPEMHGREVRLQIDRLLRTDAELTAFCQDFFPRTYQQLTPGMQRLSKVSLLLEYEEKEDVLDALEQVRTEWKLFDRLRIKYFRWRTASPKVTGAASQRPQSLAEKYAQRRLTELAGNPPQSLSFQRITKRAHRSQDSEHLANAFITNNSPLWRNTVSAQASLRYWIQGRAKWLPVSEMALGLLAPSGFGKSTLLAKLEQDLLSRTDWSKYSEKHVAHRAPRAFLPILVNAEACMQNLPTAGSMDDILGLALGELVSDGPVRPQWQALLDEFAVVLLIDGLEDISSSEQRRRLVVGLIDELATQGGRNRRRRSTPHRCLFALQLGDEDLLQTVPNVLLAPLTEREQDQYMRRLDSQRWQMLSQMSSKWEPNVRALLGVKLYLELSLKLVDRALQTLEVKTPDDFLAEILREMLRSAISQDSQAQAEHLKDITLTTIEQVALAQLGQPVVLPPATLEIFVQAQILRRMKGGAGPSARPDQRLAQLADLSKVFSISHIDRVREQLRSVPNTPAASELSIENVRFAQQAFWDWAIRRYLRKRMACRPQLDKDDYRLLVHPDILALLRRSAKAQLLPPEVARQLWSKLLAIWHTHVEKGATGRLDLLSTALELIQAFAPPSPRPPWYWRLQSEAPISSSQEAERLWNALVEELVHRFPEITQQERLAVLESALRWPCQASRGLALEVMLSGRYSDSLADLALAALAPGGTLRTEWMKDEDWLTLLRSRMSPNSLPAVVEQLRRISRSAEFGGGQRLAQRLLGMLTPLRPWPFRPLDLAVRYPALIFIGISVAVLMLILIALRRFDGPEYANSLRDCQLMSSGFSQNLLLATAGALFAGCWLAAFAYRLQQWGNPLLVRLLIFIAKFTRGIAHQFQCAQMWGLARWLRRRTTSIRQRQIWVMQLWQAISDPTVDIQERLRRLERARRFSEHLGLHGADQAAAFAPMIRAIQMRRAAIEHRLRRQSIPTEPTRTTLEPPTLAAWGTTYPPAIDRAYTDDLYIQRALEDSIPKTSTATPNERLEPFLPIRDPLRFWVRPAIVVAIVIAVLGRFYLNDSLLEANLDLVSHWQPYLTRPGNLLSVAMMLGGLAIAVHQHRQNRVQLFRWLAMAAVAGVYFFAVLRWGLYLRLDSPTIAVGGRFIAFYVLSVSCAPLVIAAAAAIGSSARARLLAREWLCNQARWLRPVLLIALLPHVLAMSWPARPVWETEIQFQTATRELVRSVRNPQASPGHQIASLELFSSTLEDHIAAAWHEATNLPEHTKAPDLTDSLGYLTTLPKEDLAALWGALFGNSVGNSQAYLRFLESLRNAFLYVGSHEGDLNDYQRLIGVLSFQNQDICSEIAPVSEKRQCDALKAKLNGFYFNVLFARPTTQVELNELADKLSAKPVRTVADPEGVQEFLFLIQHLSELGEVSEPLARSSLRLAETLVNLGQSAEIHVNEKTTLNPQGHLLLKIRGLRLGCALKQSSPLFVSVTAELASIAENRQLSPELGLEWSRDLMLISQECGVEPRITIALTGLAQKMLDQSFPTESDQFSKYLANPIHKAQPIEAFIQGQQKRWEYMQALAELSYSVAEAALVAGSPKDAQTALSNASHLAGPEQAFKDAGPYLLQALIRAEQARHHSPRKGSGAEDVRMSIRGPLSQALQTYCRTRPGERMGWLFGGTEAWLGKHARPDAAVAFQQVDKLLRTPKNVTERDTAAMIEAIQTLERELAKTP